MDTATVVPAHDRAPAFVGSVVWLAADLAFFGGLLVAYLTLRATARGEWPPHGVDLDAVRSGLFTLGLAGSSATMALAARSGAAGRRPAWGWLAATAALGAAFLAHLGSTWAGVGFSLSSHAYGSAYYLLTGVHGLHVLVGLLAMLVLLASSRGGPAGPSAAPALAVVARGWHLVAVVGAGVWVTVYVLR